MNRAELLGYQLDDPKQFQSYLEQARKGLAKELPPKEALGLPENMLEHIYTVAYDLFSAGDHENASAYFDYLTALDPENAKYILGWASTRHHMSDYLQALMGYAYALHLDESNPLPAYFIADCWLQMNQVENARGAWKEFLASTADKVGYEAQRKEAQLMLAINNTINNKK
jgi:type III secretion system low calcium response chaperone LcrH/SycD